MWPLSTSQISLIEQHLSAQHPTSPSSSNPNLNLTNPLSSTFNGNTDLDALSTTLMNKIQSQLNINRTVQEIKYYLSLRHQHTISNKNNNGTKDKKQGGSGLSLGQLTQPLFKTFAFQQNSNSNKPTVLGSLPLPVSDSIQNSHNSNQLILPIRTNFNNNLGSNQTQQQFSTQQQQKQQSRKYQNYPQFTCKRKPLKKQMDQYRSNWTLQRRLDQIQNINKQCNYTYDKFQRKLSRKASFKQQNQISVNLIWFYHQFFYSNYDRKYFQNHPMKQIYIKLSLHNNTSTNTELTLKTHKTLLSALPTPKLFNQQFIQTQKQKLQQYRNICRQTTKNLSKNNQSATQFPVHSIVLALHPMCGHLHTGSIMAYYKENLYMVRFTKPQLPAYKIVDVNMSTEFTGNNKVQMGQSGSQYGGVGAENREGKFGGSQNNGGNAGYESMEGDVIDNINFEMTGYLIKILAFKADVVKLIRSINDKIDKKQNTPQAGPSHPLPLSIQTSKQILTWATTILTKLDLLIQHTLIRFRLRGVNQQNSNLIYGNLRNLLLNPLRLMSKQFENSNQLPDINAAYKIKEIIKKQRECQIKSALNSAIMMNNNNQNNNNNNISMDKQNIIKTNLSPSNNNNNNIEDDRNLTLISCCLGILADLKYEGKGFDIENNHNLIKLAVMAGKNNSQAFNQVYERLYAIITKIKY